MLAPQGRGAHCQLQPGHILHAPKVLDLNYKLVVLRAHPRPKSNGGNSQGIISITTGKESTSDWPSSRSGLGSGRAGERKKAGERQGAGVGRAGERQQARERAADLILYTLLYPL